MMVGVLGVQQFFVIGSTNSARILLPPLVFLCSVCMGAALGAGCMRASSIPASLRLLVFCVGSAGIWLMAAIGLADAGLAIPWTACCVLLLCSVVAWLLSVAKRPTPETPDTNSE